MLTKLSPLDTANLVIGVFLHPNNIVYHGPQNTIGQNAFIWHQQKQIEILKLLN